MSSAILAEVFCFAVFSCFRPKMSVSNVKMPRFIVLEIHTELFMEGFWSHFTGFGQRFQGKQRNYVTTTCEEVRRAIEAWGPEKRIVGRMEQTLTVAGMAVVGRKAVYGTGEARNRVGYAVGAEGRGAVVRGRTLTPHRSPWTSVSDDVGPSGSGNIFSYLVCFVALSLELLRNFVLLPQVILLVW